MALNWPQTSIRLDVSIGSFDGFSGRRRLVDVRFAPKAPKPDHAGSVAFGRTAVIQTPKLGARIMRYGLADYWLATR